MIGVLFLQRSFQLHPFINKGANSASTTSIITIIAIGVGIFVLVVLGNSLRKRMQGNREAPHFSKDNFYRFAEKSGLSRKSADYLYQRVRSQRESNPMNIFFNYSYMIRVFKNIYQQEKIGKTKDIVQFQTDISQLIDSIDMLEKHFQSVSAMLSTHLIPERTVVFLSDLKNNFRIKMSIKQNRPRHLILQYKFSEGNDDARLHKIGRDLTLWLLNDKQGGGYAAYNVRLKRIKKSENGNKEYYITHNWRQAIPNITRKHKRITFSQQAKIKPSSPSNTQHISNANQIKAMMLDISLGGCSVVVNPKYENVFAKSQRISIKFPNPYSSPRSEAKKSSKEDSYYELECRITRVTVYSDEDNDGLINIHLRFVSLKRNVKNSLGLFIYGFENIRTRSLRSSYTKGRPSI